MFKHIPLKLARFTNQIFSGKFYHTIFTEIPYESLNLPLIKIRNREFLGSSKSSNLPEYVTNKPHESLRIFHTKETSVNESTGKAVREIVDEHISSHPAILFKGMKIKTAEDFDVINKNLEFKFRGYEAGVSQRQQLSPYSHTASDEPPALTIEPHNELSYVTQSMPRYMMFCCLLSAKEGGDSPVVFNKDVMKNMDPTLLQKFIDKQIRYIRYMPHEKESDYLNWQRTYNTKKEEKAEGIMLSEGINWRWNKNGSLNTWNNVPATRKHHVTGETIFASQATALHASYFYEHPEFIDKKRSTPYHYPHHATYGDGEELEETTVDYMRSVLWKSAVGLKLDQGDCLFLDNLLVMHSRIGFKGNRKVILSMIK